MKNKLSTLAGCSLIILLITVIFTVSMYGQKVVRPDFTGIWVLDLKKSNSLVAKLYRGKLKKMERFASRLEIDHKEPTIRLTEIFMAEELDSSKNIIGTRDLGRISTVYNTNEKGETNQLDRQRDWPSSTQWKGNSIFVDRPNLNASINRTTLEFSLSKDGNELNIVEKTIQRIPAVGFSDDEIPSLSGRSVYIRQQSAATVDK